MTWWVTFVTCNPAAVSASGQSDQTVMQCKISRFFFCYKSYLSIVILNDAGKKICKDFWDICFKNQCNEIWGFLVSFLFLSKPWPYQNITRNHQVFKRFYFENLFICMQIRKFLIIDIVHFCNKKIF